ncbi:metal ABC transporter permease [Mucisphaera calidilacus]|uniref:High-affinity zinc uptake system membrane protein ZnuB n=1 Tax=Mucisphaera calidilacus TaxID=2527982 RepID=A0A518BZP2_9BACT|nr:metal ABC transporter permease [Mucisphaera calidilacus]QDU72442.1 High-affinity zinc uptake system membrane protein ZnuB [Mucisphaera calidilacus]
MGFFADIQHNSFLVTGLLAGVLASVATGVIGPFVITRRIVFLSGAIAHMALAGIGGVIFLRHLFPEALVWLSPLHGAVVVALGAAVLLGVVHERVAERMDTLIGAMWAVGMALGLMLIKFTPGYHTELMSYLFGNIVYVTWSDVGLIAVLDGVILLVTALYYKQILAVCVDAQQAELRGVPVLRTQIILLCLVALTVITLIQIVGLILVLALLTLPAATAAHRLHRLSAIIPAATVIGLVVTTVPRVAVYDLTVNGASISPEPAIVLSAAGLYLLSVVLRRVGVG